MSAGKGPEPVSWNWKGVERGFARGLPFCMKLRIPHAFAAALLSLLALSGVGCPNRHRPAEPAGAPVSHPAVSALDSKTLQGWFAQSLNLPIDGVQRVNATSLGARACAADATAAFAGDAVGSSGPIDQDVLLLLGTADAPDSNTSQAFVVVGQRSGSSFVSRGVSALGEASHAAVLAVVDRARPPRAIRLTSTAGELSPSAAPLGSSPRDLAVVLRVVTQDEGPGGLHRAERLLLVSPCSTPPTTLLDALSARSAPSGEGFETTELQFVPAPDTRPDLLLLQHPLPPRGATERLPGAPLTQRFRATGSGYTAITPE